MRIYFSCYGCDLETQLHASIIPRAEDRVNRTVQLDANTVEIEERGVKLRLTVVDTPGFGDAIDNSDSFEQIIKYIDQQFDRYLKDESGLNRKNIIDNRVHCCFYFISPYGHGLKPLDIDFMKQLSNKVNIVPVIAKSDCLTMTEIKKLKARIIEELGAAGIRIYQLPDVDTDEDEEYKLQVRPQPSLLISYQTLSFILKNTFLSDFLSTNCIPPPDKLTANEVEMSLLSPVLSCLKHAIADC